MEFSTRAPNPTGKTTGIAFVALLHAALVYGLINGLVTHPPKVLPPSIPVSLPPEPKQEPVEPPPTAKIPLQRIDVAFTVPSEIFNDFPLAETAIQKFTFQPPPVGTDGMDGGGVLAESVRTPPALNAGACEKPAYPSRALREGTEGVSVLRFLVGSDGKVLDSKLARSSGSRELDGAALAGLARCAFRPGLVDGKPETAWATIRYVWKIE